VVLELSTPLTFNVNTIAQVAVAVLYSFLAAGTVFGFAALKPILIQEGAFREQCSGDEPETEYSSCYAQEIR
jgi:hypothetical protein